MKALRIIALAVLSFLGTDLVSPTLPGVFAFDRDGLFLEGTIDRAHVGADAPGVAFPSDRTCRRPVIVLARPARISRDTTRIRPSVRTQQFELGHKLPNSPPSPVDDH
jgi:hypothetical protein